MIDLTLARAVLETEAAAVLALAERLDGQFSDAVARLRDCRGRIILTGIGKSGIVGRKIAATLSSTGSPAYFVHPTDAVHGDLGMIQAEDVVIALSYSGETEELTRLLEILKADHADGDLAPQPGLAHLDELLDGMRATGLRVDSSMSCSTSPSAMAFVASASTLITRMLRTPTIIWKARE